MYGKRIRWRAMLALGTLLGLCPCAFALDPSLDVNQYAHTAWTARDGFFKGTIRAIAQTPDGYLWLGTEFGLLRFDGVRAVPWQPPPDQHLPSNDIYALLVARDGTVWIGTTKGLASWKDGKLTQYAELAEQYIFRLLEDRGGTVWAGSQGAPTGRLCAIRDGTAHCYGEDGSLGRGVAGLYEDSKGNLWVGVQDGIWRWKPGPPNFYAIPGSLDTIKAFCEDDDGTLLFVANSGIRRLVKGNAQAYPLARTLPQQFVGRMLFRDHDDGSLWIGTDHGIIHKHQGRTDVFSQLDGLSGDAIQLLFEDREGNIWVATLDGLDRFRDFAVTKISVKQDLSNVTSVLAASDGSVWFGTLDGVRRLKNGRIGIYGKLDANLKGSNFKSLLQDSRGRIWVSTARSVGYLENDRFVPVSSFPGVLVVHSIAEDTAGNLWLANQLGLIQLRGDSVVQQISWATLGRKDFATTAIGDPLEGGLWLGFWQGGVAYFKDGQVRESYAPANGLGEGRVDDLQVDRDGTLWAATQGGLSRVKDGHVDTLTTRNGLPCNAVHWMMEDDEHSVWLYMACGLVRIARPELDSWVSNPRRTIQSTVFDSSDGVTSHTMVASLGPHVSKSPDGKIWFKSFLSYDGVSVIDPRRLHLNKLPPPVHIEQIIADRKTYWQNLYGDASSSPPKLPPLVRDLEIDYSALSFIAPEKNRFRYKLEGRDRDWVDAGSRRQAFYGDLSPRKYRFRVIASNNSGVWNEAGTFLDFSVDPAYWQTNWFRSLCVAGFLALLWALYQARVRQLRLQESKLRDVIETMPTFAWSALPDGSLDFVNHLWEEYSGLSEEESAGSGWQQAVHPEELKRHVEKWRASLANGEPFENEVRLRAANGEYRWHLDRAVPLRDGRGKIVKWYGSTSDIEDRKRAEQLQAELAHLNRVTTLGELTASLAHEIKQPITATITSADTCLRWLTHDPPDVERARLTAARIKEDAQRAGDFIEHLKSLYKKAPPQRELIEVNQIVQEMAALLRGEANRYGVSMRTDLAADLPKITADRVQLQQVLMNLMLNAIEAMKETGGVVTVRSQRDQDGRLLISVSDTGVGLPADKVDQIFDAFFTTKPQGSGMGLAISRSIVESHGGRLWATSNDGRGATFHFTLPIEVKTSSTSAA